jgi:hypothetical protein
MDCVIGTLCFAVVVLAYWLDAPADASGDNGGKWR